MLFGQGDDRPLSCDWTADVGVLEPIGLTTPARRGQAQANLGALAAASQALAAQALEA